MVSICLCASHDVFHFFFVLFTNQNYSYQMVCYVFAFSFGKYEICKWQAIRSHFVHIEWIYICARVIVDAECAVKSVTFIFHKIVFYCVRYLAARR